MTKNDAISALYTCKKFNECISKMRPPDLQDDLRQEVMMVLFKKDEKTIVDMAERGELLWYAMKIVCNMMKSDRSQFAKKFRWNCGGILDQDDPSRQTEGARTFYKKIIDYEEHFSDTPDIIDLDAIDGDQSMCPSVKMRLNGRVKKEAAEDAAIIKIAEVFKDLYWYDQRVFLMYVETGSFRKMEEVTRIPWQSTYKTVRKTIQKIKEHVIL